MNPSVLTPGAGHEIFPINLDALPLPGIRERLHRRAGESRPDGYAAATERDQSAEPAEAGTAGTDNADTAADQAAHRSECHLEKPKFPAGGTNRPAPERGG